MNYICTYKSLLYRSRLEEKLFSKHEVYVHTKTLLYISRLYETFFSGSKLNHNTNKKCNI